MAMRPDMANGAVAGNRETSLDQALSGLLVTTMKEAN